MGTKEILINLSMQGINMHKRVMRILDSGCSRHMTGDRALLLNVIEKAIPIVTVRSVVFVEGGLNTNCTGLSKFVWLVLMFKYETNL